MTRETTDATQTVVLGFDALDFRYLDAFADDLPNFARLREEGVEAPLESTYPPWTGSAWPSMYTGTDPSRHGVYSFFDYGDRYPDEAELVSRNHVRAPALWNYLTAIDEPSIALNVPVTHPAEPIEGVLIPGYLATENASGYPEGVRDELHDALGEPYRIYSTHEMSDDKAKKLDGYVDLVGLRGRAATHLLSEHDWRVAVVQIQKTDAVFHNFSDEGAFREIYRAADELLGDVLDLVGDDVNVVVCSDHGMRPVGGYQIFVNQVLADHGFLESTDESGMPSMVDEKSALTADGERSSNGEGRTPGSNEDAGGAPTRDGAVESSQLRDDLTRFGRTSAVTLASALERVGVTPGDVYAYAERFGVEEPLKRLVPTSFIQSMNRSVDWERSTAYCRIGSELGVRVNLAGREPNGVVPKSEYESVCTELVDLFSSLRTPDGKPAFDAVQRREAVYDGPFTDQACDVLLKPRDMDNSFLTGLYGTQFVEVDGYNHDATGVFVGHGPAFDSEAGLDSLSLIDVAPITLAAAGFDVPERMTGVVPDGLLRAPTTRAPYENVQYGEVDDEADSTGGVEDRLADLGYLDRR